MAGLTSDGTIAAPTQYRLLRPTEVRFYRLREWTYDRKRLGLGRLGLGRQRFALAEQLEDADGIIWEGVGRVSSALSPERCLWELAGLRDGDEAGVMRLVQRWGLLSETGDCPITLQLPQRGSSDNALLIDTRARFEVSKPWLKNNRESQKEMAVFISLRSLGREFQLQAFESWFEYSRKVRAILHTLALTEVGELVEDEFLHELSAGDRWDEWVPSRGFRIGDAPKESREAEAARHRQGRAATWQRLRAEGKGLAVQRKMVVTALTGLYRPASFMGESERLEWSEHGRQLASGAAGIKGIVAEHLKKIFLSPLLGIFVCSVCGRTYPLENTGAERRPRSGFRRFCGEDCRAEAKRRSNLASWHRNKERWLRKGEQQ